METLLFLQRSKPGSWVFKIPNKYIAADPRLRYGFPVVLWNPGVLGRECGRQASSALSPARPAVPQLLKRLENAPPSLFMDSVLSILNPATNAFLIKHRGRDQHYSRSR